MTISLQSIFFSGCPTTTTWGLRSSTDLRTCISSVALQFNGLGPRSRSLYFTTLELVCVEKLRFSPNLFVFASLIGHKSSPSSSRYNPIKINSSIFSKRRNTLRPQKSSDFSRPKRRGLSRLERRRPISAPMEYRLSNELMKELERGKNSCAALPATRSARGRMGVVDSNENLLGKPFFLIAKNWEKGWSNAGQGRDA
ncbi:hypothetical protein TNCT_76091 [Trichonephila clavata]|uniref:Uncharacterized protein n=1 Tax=Trichonephila clavata TaxID=2740835 RepID=A0A8X6J307_TRICU|nr:hypothetical protein TNCT_76091 [Trichonephila clavata]